MPGEPTDRKPDEEKIESLINSGGDIAGAAIGGALGFLLGGPGGAVAGGPGGIVAANAMKRIGSDVVNRLLGPREKVRLGGAMAIAAEHIQARTERGERVRADGFFENQRAGRTDAEEVAESVLMRCQREAEEKKIRYMAYLIGNVAFEENISAHLAHQIIKSAETMTYRQFCLMKLAVIKAHFPLRDHDYRGQQQFAKNLYEVLYECLDLYSRAFVNFGGEVLFGPTDVKPASMTLQGVGIDMFNLMGLATIPHADIDPIVRVLS